MNPIVIFRHASHEGPGFLTTFLDQHAIAWQLIKIDAGDVLPASIAKYSGMVLMGGPMSVNDDLPWIAPLLNLIREAYQAEIPLLGHCLGGQLMSKALGAVVRQAPIKEIGWGTVNVSENAAAQLWFGDIETFNSFHWHGETFSLPPNAVHVLSSPYCENQAYVIGKHIAFQCHIEMTAAMIEDWCAVGADELVASADSPAVQSASVMQETLPLHCFFLNKVAAQVYGQWIKGLKI